MLLLGYSGNLHTNTDTDAQQRYSHHEGFHNDRIHLEQWHRHTLLVRQQLTVASHQFEAIRGVGMNLYLSVSKYSYLAG
jgi:hypothetical protein